MDKKDVVYIYIYMFIYIYIYIHTMEYMHSTYMQNISGMKYYWTIFKKWNSAICNNVGEPAGYYA